MNWHLPQAGVALALCVLVLWPAAASAQAPEIIVATNSPLPLLVGGLAAQGNPASVSPGSQVCVTTTVGYTSEAERWAFQGWSGPGLSEVERGPTTPCVVLTEPGLYQALYERPGAVPRHLQRWGPPAEHVGAC